ncbi:GNAT family N-acetyltransferase [Verrucomicrobiaceae bacterium 5K15]|uniref:GNAT family N-acetyltransferase n=1 Tax=Oceaniferula flava TaxID=2800421 RepID=A0AAE2SAV5_9BACT|nr:GNAT family N-acetyltransferase [Oceaniferula flavus]MBK1854746.1 GNAT family N-acetyltransferase [Oceaniferula flavus]MBM1136052.1 GNAT family N-acetyltransferase [Oceaniferula flavus]
MIRIYQHGDHTAIAEIFTRAIHEIACEDYTEEQCLAWSGRAPDPAHWKNRCELKRPFVAVVGSKIAGFLELDPDGHIDCAYVHPDFQRRGIMRGLLRHAVDTAFAMDLPRVYVEASICARPLFEQEGFQLVADHEVDLQGVRLKNYRMQRLHPGR